MCVRWGCVCEVGWGCVCLGDVCVSWGGCGCKFSLVCVSWDELGMCVCEVGTCV